MSFDPTTVDRPSGSDQGLRRLLTAGGYGEPHKRTHCTTIGGKVRCITALFSTLGHAVRQDLEIAEG